MFSSSQKSILAQYQQGLLALKSHTDTLQRKINRYSFLRLGIFLLTIILIYVFFKIGLILLIFTVLVGITVFLSIVKKQGGLQVNLQFNQHQIILLQNEVDVLQNQENVYDHGQNFENPTHPYTDDLDIFGYRSLFAYINRAATAKGKQILASWLQKASVKHIIINRQKAVTELEARVQENLDFRTQLYLLKEANFNQLQINLKDKLPALTSFVATKKVDFFCYFFPSLAAVSLLLAIVFNGVFWSSFALVMVVNYVIYNFYVKQINEVHSFISKGAQHLKGLSAVLKPIEEQDWKTEALKQLAQKIRNQSGEKTHEQVSALAKIVKDFDYRNNVFVGSFLNIFFFWDLKVIKQLHSWHQKDLDAVIQSFEVIAEFEALISLATLSYNHPQWVNPQIADGYLFKTTAMGHPLIAESSRVNNNFETANHCTIDVITGSNMAGKSTFLRTVGVNMVLAFAGAKVCAHTFETGVFNLVSYMRIKDSLMDQTSTFKAELDRLKMILQLTAAQANTFILVDEMLRGTNSKDKYLGTKVFIEKLLTQQTPGLIATHDLQIANLEKDHPQRVRNYHFDIRMEDGEMFFDYLIKDGECTTFNAAILLKAIGLSVINE